LELEHNRRESHHVQEEARHAASLHQHKTAKRSYTASRRLQKRLAMRNGTTAIVPIRRDPAVPSPPPTFSAARNNRGTTNAFDSKNVLRRAREFQAADEATAIRKRSEQSRHKSIAKTKVQQTNATKQLQKRLALRQRAKQARVLTKCKPFAKLSEEGQNEIVDQMSYEKIQDETSLCEQGDAADRMYVLMSGHCAVVVDNIPVATLHELDVFGESALFGTGEAGDKSSRRTATVTAREDLEVLVLTQKNLQGLVASGHLDQQCMDALKEVAEQRNIRNMLLKKTKQMDVEIEVAEGKERIIESNK
jgi:hypothetical protein